MSLTRWRRPRRAAAATSGLIVSTEMRTPRSAAGRPASASTTGTTRPSSTSAGTGLGAGTGGLAAHVDHVGTLGDHGEAVGDGRVEGVVEAAVGEGVRRDVEDPHDERPPSGRAGRTGVSGPG